MNEPRNIDPDRPVTLRLDKCISDPHKMIYTFEDLKHQLPYDTARKIMERHDFPQVMHLGQLKLMISEMQFLAKYAADKYRVLYIGAADGYHITILADLFPNFKFDLWDKTHFQTQPRENITFYRKYFSETYAREYLQRAQQNSEKTLVICDIRNLGVRDSNDAKINQLIMEDLQKQMLWLQIIQPTAASLKLRFPYNDALTDYLTGKCYLQPYSLFSTETRLICQDYQKLRAYDNLEQDQKFAYFNTNERIYNCYTRWQDVMEKYGIHNNWDNAISLHILQYYLKCSNMDYKDQAVGKLFIKIVKYHQKKYHEKYDVIFSPNSKYTWEYYKKKLQKKNARKYHK